MPNENRTLFEMLGGEEGVSRLVHRFYDVMDTAPEAAGIRALHPASLDESREKLRLFLIGWMGGPPLYVQRFGHPMLRARHLPFPIGPSERDAWLWCMDRALDDEELSPEVMEYLRQRFQAMADHMRNEAGG